MSDIASRAKASATSPRTLTITDSDTGKELVLPIHVPVMGVPVVQGADSVRVKLGLEFSDASLASIAVGKSAICFIDGNNSRLFYRGYSIDQLAAHGTYPEIAYLLTNVKTGERPSKEQLASFNEELSVSANIPKQVSSMIHLTSPNANPMNTLQMAVAAMSEHVPNEESHLMLAKMGTIVAEIIRHRRNQRPIPPQKGLSHSANFLYMCRENAPDRMVRAFDKARIAHAEHEMNASTFATIVTASTLASHVTSLASGVGALSGSRHGGANTAVLEMLEHIPTVKDVGPFLKAVEQGKMKLMGAGHRVYKSDDPREVLLDRESRELLTELGIEDNRVAVLDEIKRQISEIPYFISRHIHTNVDFRTGPLYTAIGFDKGDLTLLFADPRTAGWLGHVYEFLADPSNKIVRPRHEHIGPAPREFTPLQ
jgi:citrate synthase